MHMNRMAAMVLAVCCPIGAGAQEDTGAAYPEEDSLFGKNDGECSFVAYAGFAGGAGFGGSDAAYAVMSGWP